MPLTLASQSPRRARILEALGVPFEVLPTHAPEVSFPHDPERTVRENALGKLRACPRSPALAADTFRVLSEADIEDYVARVRPVDRAGAYDIDACGALVVASYTGSYENIMGLPVEPLRMWRVG